MYCAHCGNPLGDMDRFCSICGNPAAASAPAPRPGAFGAADTAGPGPSGFPAPAPLKKRPGPVTLLAVLNYVGAGFAFLGSLGLFLSAKEEPVGGIIAGSIFFILAVLSLACGYGLWTLKSWGRVLQIVLACVGLLAIGLGTIIAALTLFYMFRPGVRLLFSGKRTEEMTPQELSLLYQQTRSDAGTAIAVTVIVVLVGIALIGMITAIAIPNLLSAVQRGRQKRTIADMKTVAAAVEAYGADHNQYPDVDTIEELKKLLVPTYASRIPTTDGWDRPLKYERWLENDTDEVPTLYVLGSAGKDGAWERKDLIDTPEGRTTDFNADIVLINGDFVQFPEGIELRGKVGGTDGPRTEPSPPAPDAPLLRSDLSPAPRVFGKG